MIYQKTETEIIKPRPHQQIIIRDSILHFSEKDRGYIECSCGSGKSLTSFWINQHMNNKLAIAAVPSLYLLSQFYKEYAVQAFNEKYKIDFILVGSDADVDECEYINNGLLITTDPKEIRDKINRLIGTYKYEGKEFHRIVIITTYQSSDKLINALEGIEPDLCIFDEAHKCVGGAEKQFNLMLDDNNIKIKKRLFMTATPKIFNGDSEKEEILSMDDEEWFGERISLYNTSDAIKDKYLVDYQIVTMYTDDKYIQKYIEKNNYVCTEELQNEESHYIGCAIMLLNAIKDGMCNHLVTYHNSINKSKKFKNILESLLRIIF